VFLTKNGVGDMVVMSLDDYRTRKFAHDIDLKLIEACEEAIHTDKRFTHNEVMGHMRKIINNTSPKV
jgi:hypothetical protein